MTELDWARLQRLRDRFLATTDTPRAIPDYWLEPADLAVYDQVLAQRIGWKWDAVLEQLGGTAFFHSAPGGDGLRVLDWGCGTGIASRRFLHRIGANQILLHDRSTRAVDFAKARLLEQAAQLDCRAMTADDSPDILLLSHVLGELDERREVELLTLVERCPRVLWVEAGTRAIARRLSAIRDRLLDRFHTVAPCPHQSTCSALRAGDQHWCHAFARPPAEVFMDPTWTQIGKQLQIDLRSLPYHFLALTRLDAGNEDSAPVEPKPRLIGRPQVRNKFVRFYQCEESGLTDRTVYKGQQPELYKRVKKLGSQAILD